MDKPIKPKREFTAEHRAKLSAARTGKPAWNKGVPMSDATKAKLSALRKGIVSLSNGKVFSESHKKKLSDAKIGRPGPWAGKKRPAMTGEKHFRWKGGYANHLHCNRRRKAQKKSNGGTHTLAEWIALKEKFKNTCLVCKKPEPEVKLTADHIVPISMGGSDDIQNIQPLCSSCNAAKGNRWINDFRQNENGAWVDLV